MKLALFTILVAALAAVMCDHRFVGTNVNKTLVYHYNAKYSPKVFYKSRVENLYYFMLPSANANETRLIQGILAYDLTNSSASAHVTEGGVGYHYMNLKMEAEPQNEINYDVYVYI